MRLSKGLLLALAALLALPLAGIAQLSGTYNVGSGGAYPTLTAALNALNANGVSGPVTFLLTDASYGPAETFPLTINVSTNVPTATKTVTIKPAPGVQTTISGAVNSFGVFDLFYTSYITIDGSNNGSSSRNLTIQNTGTTGCNTIWIGSASGKRTDYITVKNCVLINGSTGAVSVLIGSSSKPPAKGYLSNIAFQNNDFQKALTGMYVNGESGTNTAGGTNVTVINNTMNHSSPNNIRYRGLDITGIDGVTVRGNDIGNMTTTADEQQVGIAIGPGCKNVTVEKNLVHDIAYAGSNGSGPKGIAVGVGSGTVDANVLVANNMISNMSGDGDDFTQTSAQYAPVGIYLSQSPESGAGQAGIKLYYNTVFMSGHTLNKTGAFSFGIAMDAGKATVKDNIVVNNLGLAGSTGVGAVGLEMQGTAQIIDLDYNRYYCAATAGANYIGKIGTNNYATLAAFASATGKDGHSTTGNVVFVSPSDLHLTGVSVGDATLQGVAITGITTDYDGDTRVFPYMGADEEGPLPVTFSSFSATVDPDAGGVRLAWTTLSEVKNFGYYVQRSYGNESSYADLPGVFIPGHGTTLDPHSYAFVDATLFTAGRYYYRLRQVDLDGAVLYGPTVMIDLSTLSVTEPTPREFKLFQNYPNPFNPQTQIQFSVENPGRTTLLLYDLTGREVAVLFDGMAEAGRFYAVQVNASGLATGMYLYRLQNGTRVETRKMMVVK